jgi:adenylate cyclase
MHFSWKEFLGFLWQSVIFWMLAYLFFEMMQLNGPEVYGSLNRVAAKLTWWDRLKISVMAGGTMGFLYAIIEYGFQLYWIQRFPLWKLTLSKILVYFVVLILFFSGFLSLMDAYLDMPIEIKIGWWRQSEVFWVGILFFMVASFVFELIRIINNKFGPGVFYKLMMGSYRTPKETKRIFLFIDLKSSTEIAERLGHYKYSRFIQDCFLDLNAVYQKFDADIYQYVGDEAVLTWAYDSGLKDNNCVALFFAFREQIDSRANYYQKKYGTIPVFKAGLHGGTLIAAEVGGTKRDLAYHGDVINTTARIQASCNGLGASFLVSDEMLAYLALGPEFKIKSLGNHSLRGKRKNMGLSALSLC